MDGVAIPIEVTDLPSLNPPDDERFLHLFARGSVVADCGAGRTDRPCSRNGKPWLGERFCPACGKPVCPACAAIARTEERSGIRP